MDPVQNADFEKCDGTQGGQHPPLRDLFIAEEQPGEANAAALAYLDAHPEVRQFIERQKILERMADALDDQLGSNLPDFEPDGDGDAVDTGE